MGVEDRDGPIEWHKIAIDQLGYALNLIFTLTIAALGYCFVLLKDKDFIPTPSAKCAMFWSLSVLALSAALGIACTFNRLRDFRGTSRRSYGHQPFPSKEQTDRWGEWTWRLFYTQFVSFAFGIVALAITLLLTYGGKLH